MLLDLWALPEGNEEPKSSEGWVVMKMEDN
jgi:hypothetical protein